MLRYPNKPDSEAETRRPNAGFRDVAPEAGITFRMSFLPREQGENFKVNLYDHGCGVAVADFDGQRLSEWTFAGPTARGKP